MRKIVFTIALIILLIIINNLSRSIYDLYKKQDLLTVAQNDLLSQQRENQKLKSQLSNVNNPQFVEQEARDKLFLVKPGEEQILIPQNLLNASASAKKAEVVPNWQQWLGLFL